MRKQYKNKTRSCGLCKPHKRGWDHRWKPKQRQAMLEAAREVRSVHFRARGLLMNIMPSNNALQPTAQPLRGFASAELGRYEQ